MNVRTRIAPSPTGEPHVGTGYIALFNYAFAKKNNGQFILRLEDTDQLRSQAIYADAIMQSLKWLGLTWDEGPDIGGDYGPYKQSDRFELYQTYAQQLIEEKKAFHCFCSAEQLEEKRQKQIENGEKPKYDGYCLTLSNAEIQNKLAKNRPYVIRMKVPEDGYCEFNDRLRGPIRIAWSEIDMQVLIKTDGLPTYHLANVVDDHLMKITHVIRGEEWINSAPKHILLYQYFNWQIPELCHMPLLRNQDKSKLSKRKNPTSINYYKDAGFLPESLLNYLGHMGWSMPNEQERFTIQEMIEAFDMDRVSLGGPIFDVEKLRWLNSLWIRETLDETEFLNRLISWKYNSDFCKKFISQAQQRVSTLGEVAHLSQFMLADHIQLPENWLTNAPLPEETLKIILQLMIWQLEKLTDWRSESIFFIAKNTAKFMKIKLKNFNWILFMAIVGQADSWSVMSSIEILGAPLTLARLRNTLNTIGIFSQIELKKLEEDYKILLK